MNPLFNATATTSSLPEQVQSDNSKAHTNPSSTMTLICVLAMQSASTFFSYAHPNYAFAIQPICLTCSLALTIETLFKTSHTPIIKNTSIPIEKIEQQTTFVASNYQVNISAPRPISILESINSRPK